MNGLAGAGGLGAIQDGTGALTGLFSGLTSNLGTEP